jgi:hypothetical protein
MSIQMCTFHHWFEKYWRNRGELLTSAISRLSLASGISYKSLFYAHKGARVRKATEDRIRLFSGNRIKAGSMVDGSARIEQMRGGR